jgi:hypothetical protein
MTGFLANAVRIFVPARARSSGVEVEVVRMKDDCCVNVARINRGRVCM